MKLLILGGVDNAGKSKTIRYSTKHLGINANLVAKFLTQRNPPKRVLINNVPVYIYCTSPQEIAGNDASKCKKVFKNRIDGKEPSALIIMPFNLESKYQQGIESCLDEINGQNLKKSTSFVFLDVKLPEFINENNQAHSKIEELKQRGYLIVGEITRTMNTTKDEQGKDFAVYVKDRLKP